MNKKVIKGFCILILVIAVISLFLSIFYSSAFIPACMLMFALFLFGVCYYIKEDKKKLMYLLFVLGIILIFCSLGYTFMRLR